jgi:hypothetical protein
MLADNSICSLSVLGGALLIILLTFRVAGVLQCHEILARLRQKQVLSRRERGEQKVFEDRQLQFQRVRDVSQWWQAICETASQMNFAWLSLTTTHEDGRREEELWEVRPTKRDAPRMITMVIPLTNGNGRAGVSRRLEIAIYADDSIESASHRATLFGRLIDEYGQNQELATGCWRSGVGGG